MSVVMEEEFKRWTAKRKVADRDLMKLARQRLCRKDTVIGVDMDKICPDAEVHA